MRGAHRRTIRNLARMRLRRPMRGVLAVVCAALLVGSGCARFDDTQSQPFTTEPELTPGAVVDTPAPTAATAQTVPQGVPRPRCHAGLPGEHQRADHAARQPVGTGGRADDRRGERGVGAAPNPRSRPSCPSTAAATAA